MVRIAQLDVPNLARPVPVIVSQLAFGLVCSALTLLVRLIIDIWLPGAGPFALTVPMVLVATLFGRWLSGVTCQTLVALHAWYFVLPIEGSFSFSDPADGPRVFVNMAAGYFVVFLAELFRRAMRQAMQDREMLLLELEHRVKNSFASIASVVRLQMRSSKSGDAEQALQSVLGRIESFAHAYSYLNYRHGRFGSVNIGPYLKDLCKALEAASGTGGAVRFVCSADDHNIPRDRAIAIGLLVNEVTTNAIKHAFNGGGGQIDVSFEVREADLELRVGDNGHGMPENLEPSQAEGQKRSGLGMKIMDALAIQAEATFSVDTSGKGTVYTFKLAKR